VLVLAHGELVPVQDILEEFQCAVAEVRQNEVLCIGQLAGLLTHIAHVHVEELLGGEALAELLHLLQVGLLAELGLRLGFGIG